jgi:hypothetical protein
MFLHKEGVHSLQFRIQGLIVAMKSGTVDQQALTEIITELDTHCENINSHIISEESLIDYFVNELKKQMVDLDATLTFQQRDNIMRSIMWTTHMIGELHDLHGHILTISALCKDTILMPSITQLEELDSELNEFYLTSMELVQDLNLEKTLLEKLKSPDIARQYGAFYQNFLSWFSAVQVVS